MTAENADNSDGRGRVAFVSASVLYAPIHNLFGPATFLISMNGIPSRGLSENSIFEGAFAAACHRSQKQQQAAASQRLRLQ